MTPSTSSSSATSRDGARRALELARRRELQHDRDRDLGGER